MDLLGHKGRRLPVVETSPFARRREVGALLRAHRQRLGLSGADVAAKLDMSPAKLSRLERGERGLQINDVRVLCSTYALDDEETNRLVTLARASREPGWWSEYTDLDDVAPMLYGLETASSQIQAFYNSALPGLLQTRDYVRALLGGIWTTTPPTAEWIEPRVDARLHRQRLLDAAPAKTFHFILDEAALLRAVGTASTMATQVRHILEQSTRPNVQVQVLPFAAGSHPALDGPFLLMRFAEEVLVDTVFIEGVGGSLFIEDPVKVRAYADVFSRLHDLALGAQESSDWLRSLENHWSALAND